MNNSESQYYHIYNRGVEKRKIFQEKSDYFRFINDLYEFNDTAPADKDPGRYLLMGRQIEGLYCKKVCQSF